MADQTITQLSTELLALPSNDAQLSLIYLGVDNINNFRSEKVSLKTIKNGLATSVEKNILTGVPTTAVNNRDLNFGGYNANFNNVNSFNVQGAAPFLFNTPDFILSDALSLSDSNGVANVTISAHPSTGNYDVQLPQSAPNANGQVMLFNIDGTTVFSSLGVTGQYRGTLTLAGGSPNLPDANDGTLAIGDPLVAGDYWRIAADGTLDDGVGTTAVTAGQLLIIEDPTASELADFAVIGSTGADTNIFNTNGLTATGARSHSAGGYDFGILNIDKFTLQANEFGVLNALGQAFAILPDKSVSFPGYIGAAQDGPVNRLLGVTIGGRLQTLDVPPVAIAIAHIRLESSLAPGETLNIQTGLDGAGVQHTMKAESVGTVSLASLPTQLALAASPYFSTKVNGLEADKTNDPAAWLSVVRESDTELSFEANTLPAGTLIEITLLS